MPIVNDIHARLNPTGVAAIVRPESVADLSAVIADAAASGRAVCVAGGRHAMGGQQFATDGVLIDTRSLDRFIGLDHEAGIVEVEAGIQWPALIDGLLRAQAGRPHQWGIIQKQTGADRLSLGGALAANIHGRGLRLRPIVGDVESFDLIGAEGGVRRCSRAENPELFRCAIGGYGLFGVIARVRLRLTARRKLRRSVAIIDLDDVGAAFARRIAAGDLYGDFQFMTCEQSPHFIRRGVFSSYAPVADDVPVSIGHTELDADDWRRLYHLAHVDRQALYEAYSGFYRATDGQIYWSDLHQAGVYIDGYHDEIDRRAGHAASEMISELYVPRPALSAFCAAIRADLRQHAAVVIYGTIRLVEAEDETCLAWARQPWACVVINLCVDHRCAGLARAEEHFRRLIDRAIEFGGSFYLTYHRWATRAQIATCHPRLAETLRRKRSIDPGEVFQSDWYRHLRALFTDVP